MTHSGRYISLIALVTTVSAGSLAWAYGGGGGGSGGCEDPKFLKPVPANNSSVPSLTEFSFLASDTDASTLIVQIDGATVATDINPLRSGDLQVTAHPRAPMTAPGRARITAEGKSKEGCAGFAAFYVDIKP